MYIKKISEKISSTTERISKIVKGLQSFARNGDKDPFDAVSLEELVQETFGICQEKFKINGVQLTFEKPSQRIMIECRSTQIIQVLLSLLNNAFDAIQVLSEKWVKVEINDLGQFIDILVTDSGKGIPAVALDKIFQPFFTTKEIGRGTGLGLSVSKGIVEDHKGGLSVNSDCPNTQFVIHLPKQCTTLEQKAG